MQVFCLPTLRITAEIHRSVAPVREVQDVSSGILGGTQAQRHAVDDYPAVPTADLTRLKLFETRPDGEFAGSNGGCCREANTGRDALLIEEREPCLADELPVRHQAPN